MFLMAATAATAGGLVRNVVVNLLDIAKSSLKVLQQQMILQALLRLAMFVYWVHRHPSIAAKTSSYFMLIQYSDISFCMH